MDSAKHTHASREQTPQPKKPLSEMTLSELWELFPVVLKEHDPRWAEQYREEAATLQAVLPEGTECHHIGSTAVAGIRAKPIVDILVVVRRREQLREVACLLQRQGYLIMSESDERISLNKGYTENGFAEKVFHAHVRLAGDTDELYFREYLRAHPKTAKEYEALKLRLAETYEHDRDAYTDGKTEFVKQYTALAVREQSVRTQEKKGGKYRPLWEHIRRIGSFPLRLTFEEIAAVLGFSLDHAFLSAKKETADYGFTVKKISLKEKFVLFEKL